MKRLLIILIFLLIALQSYLFAAFSKQQAIDLVLNTVLKKDIGMINVYMNDSLMTKPDSLVQCKGSKIELAYDNSWVFFIDDHPDLLWNHDCRYCFVSADSSDYTIINGDFYPSNIYDDFQCISAIPASTLPELSLPPTILPAPATREPNSHLWAVIICGDELNNDIAGWADD